MERCAVEVPPEAEGVSGVLPFAPASLASASGQAILTAAKPGSYDPTSLVLRLYQPTNQALNVAVTLPGGAPAEATLVTAAETQWQGGGSAMPAGNGVTVEMAGALATVQIAGLGRPTPKTR